MGGGHKLQELPTLKERNEAERKGGRKGRRVGMEGGREGREGMQIPGHMLTNCSFCRPGGAEKIRGNSCIYKLSKEKYATINRRGEG